MSNPTLIRRRWFQFSIGTMLLLITVFAVWLAWELAFVRARRAYLANLNYAQWHSDGQRMFNIAPPPAGEHATIPFWRSLLGDKPIDFIVLPTGWQPEDLKTGKALIPEATFFRQSRGGAVPAE